MKFNQREGLDLFRNFNCSPEKWGIVESLVVSFDKTQTHLKSVRSLNLDIICGYKSSLISSHFASERNRQSKHMNSLGMRESIVEWYLVPC